MRFANDERVGEGRWWVRTLAGVATMLADGLYWTRDSLRPSFLDETTTTNTSHSFRALC
jgi:hypothetical protein